MIILWREAWGDAMGKVAISAYEFLKKFPDQRAARTYIEQRRWHGRPACPHCGETQRVQVRKVDGYFRCLACKVDFTVRTGTVFERSHVPLDKWLYAIYLLVTSRKGVSSLQLSKEIGVTQKTAWFMLQRLREACGNNTGDGDWGQLTGIVEADETYIGGKEMNKHEGKKLKAGRGTVGKTSVLGLRSLGGTVKAAVIDGTGAASIQPAVRKCVEPGAVLSPMSMQPIVACRNMTTASSITAPSSSCTAWRTPTASRASGRCSTISSASSIYNATSMSSLFD